MSSVMPLTSNAVELCVVTINEKHWTRAKEVRRALGYQKGRARNALNENKQHKYELEGCSAVSPLEQPKNSQRDEYYINKEGRRELLVRSQHLLAKELAEYMGIKIVEYKYVRKEAGTIYTIQKVFEGISMKRQISIVSYRSTFIFLSINYLPADADIFKTLQDVLKRSRRLTIKQDVVTTSGKRHQIYDVLKTSDLRRVEDVQFTTS